MVVGGESTTVTVVETHTWEPGTASGALALITVDDPGPRPDEPGAWFPWAAPIGFVVGAGAGAGVAYLALLDRVNALIARGDPTYAPAIYAGVMVPAALAGLVVGGVVDYGAYQGVARQTTEFTNWEEQTATISALAVSKTAPMNLR